MNNQGRKCLTFLKNLLFTHRAYALCMCCIMVLSLVAFQKTSYNHIYNKHHILYVFQYVITIYIYEM